MVFDMLIILPPSETKNLGDATNVPADSPGVAPSESRLNVGALGFAGLNPTRTLIAERLVTMAELFAEANQDHDETRMAALDKLIGIRATQRDEHRHNAALFTSPTMPAIERYTGVAFDMLDATGARSGIPLDSQARSRLAIGSALFGVVRADDPIPYYRFSAHSKTTEDLNHTDTVRSLWKKPASGNSITDELVLWRENAVAEVGETDAGIIDLRSGGYRDLGTVPAAVSLRVENEYSDGSRKVVSHFNKSFKGTVARELAMADVQLPADREGRGDLAAAFADAIGTFDVLVEQGCRAEVTSPTEVTLIVPTT